MTDTPPKPKRRHWRWLVVGLLLFCGLGVSGWWLQSMRIDGRLIGSWTGSNGGPQFTIHEDGMVTGFWHPDLESPESGIHQSTDSCPCRIRGGGFELLFPYPKGLQRMYNEAEAFVRGQRFGILVRGEILKFDGGELQLRFAPGCEQTYRKL